MLFFTVWLRKKKKERQKIGKKVFPPEPTFFILPNYEENEKGKVMRNKFYTNTPTLLHSPTPLTFLLLDNKDIIVNLYKLHFSFSHFSFQPNKKVFHPLTFSTSPTKHTWGKTKSFLSSYFFILPLIFHPLTFPLLHLNRPLIYKNLWSTHRNSQVSVALKYEFSIILICPCLLPWKSGIGNSFLNLLR